MFIDESASPDQSDSYSILERMINDDAIDLLYQHLPNSFNAIGIYGDKN